jgi:hypothetical protein
MTPDEVMKASEDDRRFKAALDLLSLRVMRMGTPLQVMRGYDVDIYVIWDEQLRERFRELSDQITEVKFTEYLDAEITQ